MLIMLTLLDGKSSKRADCFRKPERTHQRGTSTGRFVRRHVEASTNPRVFVGVSAWLHLSNRTPPCSWTALEGSPLIAELEEQQTGEPCWKVEVDV